MAIETVPVPEPTDQQLFRDAMTPETPAAPPAQETAAPPPPEGERPRDEQGRFVAREPQPEQPQPDQPVTPPQAAQPPQPDGQPPSGRFKEMREERDAALNRTRELEFALYDMQRQLGALQQQQATAKPPEAAPIPDVITDPQGYHQYIQGQFQKQLREQEQNYSFRLAHLAHGEVFEQAYATMLHRAQRGDPSVVQAVMSSPDCGSACVNWFRREQLLSTVGDDPNAWFDKELDRRIADQKQAAGILEKMRAATVQQQQSNGQGGPVQLPPSLSRIPSAAPAAPVGDAAMTSANLFDFAFRQGRPQR